MSWLVPSLQTHTHTHTRAHTHTHKQARSGQVLKLFIVKSPLFSPELRFSLHMACVQVCLAALGAPPPPAWAQAFAARLQHLLPSMPATDLARALIAAARLRMDMGECPGAVHKFVSGPW